MDIQRIGTCKDCRWWAAAPRGTYKEQDVYDPGIFDETDRGVCWASRVAGLQPECDGAKSISLMLAGPDFGCTRFEAKDQDAWRSAIQAADDVIVEDWQKFHGPEASM